MYNRAFCQLQTGQFRSSSSPDQIDRLKQLSFKFAVSSSSKCILPETRWSPQTRMQKQTRKQAPKQSFDTLVGDTLVERSCGTLSRDTSVTLWDTLAGHCCRTLLWDTLVDSCATLLQDFLVGTLTTLTYSDVIRLHKLTALRPQLPEAASCTTFALQIAEAACRATFVLPSGQF